MKTFETKANGFVGQVAAAASQLQSNRAINVRHCERRASKQPALPRPPEEASANVQTVAAATEELSSSVTEISAKWAIFGNGGHSGAGSGAHQQNRRRFGRKRRKIGAIVQRLAPSPVNQLAGSQRDDRGRGPVRQERASLSLRLEVKNLANQTAKATEEIGNKLDKFRPQQRGRCRH